MDFLENRKSRRVRGAELVVTGGVTMFLSSILGWVAPIAFCVYGVYRWLLRKSYKEGITSLAIGILLLTLLRGPLNAFLWLSMLAGGFLLGLGLILMILPSRKSDG
jgi:hypothetical protein